MGANWWGVFLGTPAESSVLAFVTTLHCALTVLRKYRPRGATNAVLIPSLFFVVSPWLLPSFFWLAAIFTTHIGWFIACETLLPAPASPKPPVPRPAAAAAPQPAVRAVPQGFRQLPVLAVVRETPEIRTFRLARPPGLNFKAGQFLMVKAEIDGKPIIRCYSISSSPSVPGYLEISVRNQGKVSGFLHATVRPGTTLNVNGPGGAFVYPDGTRPIVLIAGGIGITPLLSMLRHALEAEPARPVTLLLSARSEAHLPFADELRVLARRHALFRLVIALSGGADNKAFYSGRIDASLIETVVEHVRESVYLICGPFPMIEAMQGMLAALGVPDGQVHFEKFEVAASARAVVAAAEELAPASAPAPSSNGLRVRLQRRGAVVPARRDQSMLVALETAGQELPSMCRAGVCGTCRVKLIEGTVEGDFGALDNEDQADGYVLACVARPVTNCVIDA